MESDKILFAVGVVLSLVALVTSLSLSFAFPDVMEQYLEETGMLAYVVMFSELTGIILIVLAYSRKPRKT